MYLTLYLLTCQPAWEVQIASGCFQCIQDCGVPEQTDCSRDSRYILGKETAFFNAAINHPWIPNIILKACGEVLGILRIFSWVPESIQPIGIC